MAEQRPQTTNYPSAADNAAINPNTNTNLALKRSNANLPNLIDKGTHIKSHFVTAGEFKF